MNDGSAPVLTAGEMALARHHSYSLLSRLFLEGLTSELRPFVRAIPELAGAVFEPFQVDEAAARHHNLFRFNIFPHESMFLDPDGLLGGPAADEVLRAYQSGGFAFAGGDTGPDHIGQELAFLAFLAGAEADAHAHKRAHDVQRIQRLQQRFLAGHLLRWLLPLTLAVEEQGHPFYTAVSWLTWEIALAQVSESMPDGESNADDFSLPPAPALLAEEKTGLKDIAAWLVSPPISGIVLGRDDIARMARAHSLPRGFGKRDRMLHNLLRSAAQYDALPALLDRLLQLVDRWVRAYDRWVVTESDSVARSARVWQAQARHTATVLTQLQQGARSIEKSTED